MTRMCYLAAPIDFAQGRTATAIQEATNLLYTRGFYTFCPATAFDVPRHADPDPRIMKINHRALTLADCCLALLPAGVPTIGTPMEIQKAVSQAGIPTAVVGGEGSWALAHPNPMLYRTNDPEDAVEWLAHYTPLDVSGWEQRRQKMFVVADQPELMPTRKYDGDAGFDLFVAKTTDLMPQSFTDVPAGIRVEMPETYWGMIVGRSSTIRDRGLQVQMGIIDNGWRGELFAGVWNMANKPVTVFEGERLAQFIVFSNSSRVLDPVLTDFLNPSDRGEAGFGSTGR